MREYGRCDLGSLHAIVEMVLVCTLSAHRNADGHLYLYVVCMYVVYVCLIHVQWLNVEVRSWCAFVYPTLSCILSANSAEEDVTYTEVLRSLCESDLCGLVWW